MKQIILKVMGMIFIVLAAAPCSAQFGEIMRKVQDKAQQVKDKANKANELQATMCHGRQNRKMSLARRPRRNLSTSSASTRTPT